MNSKKYHLHIAINPDFAGEVNIGKSLAKLLEESGMEKYDLFNWVIPDEESKFLENLKAHSEILNLIITIGRDGVDLINKIDPSKNIIIFWTGHEFFPELTYIINKVNIIAIPKHALTSENETILKENKIKLVTTYGTLNTIDKHELLHSYKHWQKDCLPKIPDANNYLAIILGGDSPGIDNEPKLFLPDEAAKIGKYVSKLLKYIDYQPQVLVLNSPRTGKHTQKTLYKSYGEVDQTSQSLLKVLDKNNVAYQFFNYASGKDSAYLPVLYLLSQNLDNMVLITGDSINMLTEISSNIKNENIFVVSVESMNPAHQEFLEELNRDGLVRLVKMNEEISQLFVNRDVPNRKDLTESRHEMLNNGKIISAALQEAVTEYNRH
jgi:mitochondrial fission protein ELM1